MARQLSLHQKDDQGPVPDGKPVVGQLDLDLHGALGGMVLDLLAAAHIGVCVCDERDHIRYLNEAWKSAVFPDLPDVPVNFAEALEAAIATGKGCRLESMPLGEFIPVVRARRREFLGQRNFSVDLVDGRWWWVSEYKLPNGWILAVSADISTVKFEEFKLREAHAAAIKDSQTDVLTGIANRRRGMEHAAAALKDSLGARLPLSIAILDVDHFKRLNDAYGHEFGDGVLVCFAKAIGEWGRACDIVSRIGGEEFLVIMPEQTSQEAKLRLDVLLRTLAPVPRDGGKPPLMYSFSAGVASACSDDTLKALLARADAALYRAKTSGRRRVETSLSD